MELETDIFEGYLNCSVKRPFYGTQNSALIFK